MLKFRDDITPARVYFCYHSPAEVHTPLKPSTQSSVQWSHSLVSSCYFLLVTDNSGLHSDEGIINRDIWEYCHIICRFCSLNLQAKLSCFAKKRNHHHILDVMDVDNDEWTWKKMISLFEYVRRAGGTAGDKSANTPVPWQQVDLLRLRPQDFLVNLSLTRKKLPVWTGKFV